MRIIRHDWFILWIQHAIKVSNISTITGAKSGCQTNAILKCWT